MPFCHYANKCLALIVLLFAACNKKTLQYETPCITRLYSIMTNTFLKVELRRARLLEQVHQGHFHQCYQDNCWPILNITGEKYFMETKKSKVIVTKRPSKSKPSNPDSTI